MDHRFLTVLALRLLGIYALLQTLNPLHFLIASFAWAIEHERGWGLFDWGSVLSLIAWLAAGLTLLSRAPAIAARLTGRQGAQFGPSPIAAQTVEVLGYRLLGAYAFLTYAPSLVSNVSAGLGLVDLTGQSFMTRDTLTSILGTLAGLWMLLGARGLASLVDLLRGVGLQEAEQAWKTPIR